MPRNITVTFEDGSTHVYQQAPDNITPEQVQSRAQKDFGKAVASLDGGRSAAVEAGSAINQIPRQLGLTARYGLEGLGQAAEIVTEPIRQNITDPLARLLFKPSMSDLVTGKRAPQGKPLGQFASDVADYIGLPKPQDANERVVADASRMVAGAGGMAGAGRALSQLPGMAGRVGNFLGQNVGNQAVSAAGAGAASGASREAGGDPAMQAFAGLAGGLAAPAAVGAAKAAAQKVSSAFVNRFAPQVVDRNVENTINLTLRRQGINWGDIDASTRAQVRNDVRDALNAGQDLNGDALRRLIDFRRVGATPTVGALTLDPVQITREKNLAKMGANSSDTALQQLAQVENRNNNTFISNLNDAGAARAQDAHATGETLIGALNSYADRQRQNIGSLYGAARDSAGRSAELDGHAFTQRANQLLQENLAGRLPGQIEDVLNNIASGRVPLTVDHAEQIKTALGRIQRTTSDGNERYAMGLIRQALDEAPLRASPQVNHGNLPAVSGTVPPSTATVGQESIDAFNRARAANRQFMQTVENTPALDAAMNGAAPDTFLRQFVTGNGGRANVRDVSAMTELLQSGRVNPDNLPATAAQIRALPTTEGRQALEATKNAIADHLKQRALNGAADEVGNFSQAAYNKALREIGDRKLALFFTPEEMAQLHAVGRVSSYAQFQPRGSAVNNSNSGALMLGKGLDFLASLGSKIPLGLNDTITGKINGVQASRAMNTSRGLLNVAEPVPLGERLAPGLIYGGLLAAPQVIPNR